MTEKHMNRQSKAVQLHQFRRDTGVEDVANIYNRAGDRYVRLIDRQIGPHADVFAEYIGDYQTRGLPVHELKFGGSYRLTQRQQIDFHAGFGLNRNSPDYFVGVGYSLRFDGLW
jgi:Putative MetA-pathway of phenol degradation